MEILDELDELGKVMQAITKALRKYISIDVGLFSVGFTIEQILEGLGNIPGVSQLTSLATKALDPILSGLGMSTNGVPGLSQAINGLSKVTDKLNVAEEIKHNITGNYNLLNGENNPMNTMKNINAAA